VTYRWGAVPRQIARWCVANSDNKTPTEILDKIGRNAEACPWAECNFLKKPFLQACRDAGLV